MGVFSVSSQRQPDGREVNKRPLWITRSSTELKIQKNLQSSARFLCLQPASVCLLHFIPELIACPYAVLHDPPRDDHCFNWPFVLGVEVLCARWK